MTIDTKNKKGISAGAPTREGYKLTRLGWIPEEWDRLEFGNFAERFNEKYNPQAENGNNNPKCIELENIEPEKGRITSYFDANEQKSIKNKFYKGQVLFGKLRPYLKKFWLASFNGVCSSEIWVLKPIKNKIDNIYLFYLVQSHTFIELCKVSSGTKMPRADWDYISKFPFSLAPLPEQQKIAQILSTWDKAIEKTEQLIRAKTQLKKGLMQQLLTGKKRFPAFASDSNKFTSDKKASADKKEFEGDKWNSYKIEEIISKFQNGNAFSSKGYVKKGVPIITMAQISLDGSFKFDYDAVNYWPVEELPKLKSYILNKEDLLMAMTDVTPSKNLIGRMAIIDREGPFLLNQRVGHLKVNTDIVNSYFLQELSNSKHWRKYSISVATLGVQANMSTKDILKGKVKLPTLKEQKKITSCLSGLEDEIIMLHEMLAKFQEHKKGLMQKLLTGKVRVKI